ncbi:MAG: fimbrillin family protein [Bacteroidia bacterium]|nr:fimbrillin family protein [Bacteroidia bacterium]
MKIRCSFLFLMLLFLLACEGEKIDFSIINRSIKVNARIDGVKTRATNDTWSEGDAIGIYMIAAGEAPSAESVLVKNAKYTTQGDGGFNPATVANDVKFPINGSNVDFIAYYPHGTINAAFEYSIDVTDQSNQAVIDLLYSDNSKNLNKNSAFVDLSFSHQLSKIIVNLKTIDGSALINPSVTIKGIRTRGFFSLADKTQRVTATKGNIEMKMNSSGVMAEAIVLPTAALAGITLEIVNGDYGYVYDLSSAENVTSFQSGYKHTYTITLDTRAPLSAVATISNWMDGPNEKVTIVKDFKVYKPVGAGTQENPYTIEDARNISPVNGVWVKGFIVGHYTGTSVGSFSNDITNPEIIKETSVALAVSATEANATRTYPIQLSTNDLKAVLSLKSKPENLGKEVKVKGNIANYYSAIGMTGVSAYEFITADP